MEGSRDDGFLLQVPGAVRRKSGRENTILPSEHHFREIDQRSLVDAPVEAVIGAESHGRIRILQL